MKIADAALNEQLQPRGLVLHVGDNVAVMLDNVEAGAIELMGSMECGPVTAIERIAAGHKVALRPIERGEAVVKYGVTIGVATEPIAAGGWVHTHNCRSELDERSHTLDRHTGAPTDTQYA